MAETTEPPLKKAKTENIDKFIKDVVNSKTNLLPILDDMYINSVPLIKCFAGHVKDITQLSSIIRILNEKLPLKELNHLKRVCKHSVLICPMNYFINLSHGCIRDFILDYVPELKDTFEYIRDVEVPAIAPLTKKQSVLCNKKWTCNFHPNKYIEKMLSDSCFIQKELRLHRTYMGMAFEIAKIQLSQNNYSPILQDLFSVNAAIVIDPTVNKVVAIGFDNRQEHPVQHAAMVAIDNVAKTQTGGAWNKNEKLNKEVVWKLRNKFVDVVFGARKFVSKKNATESDKVESPYLCTGYDIYLVREPCVMCAMGLVHARIKRVFYTFENHSLGALRSKTKLHCVPHLNHRFEVFTGFEN